MESGVEAALPDDVAKEDGERDEGGETTESEGDDGKGAEDETEDGIMEHCCEEQLGMTADERGTGETPEKIEDAGPGMRDSSSSQNEHLDVTGDECVGNYMVRGCNIM